MRYIRVYNESASPVTLRGLLRTYVVGGRIDAAPMIEDIPFEDVSYINGRCDVFRTGRLKFDESEADAIMEELRIPNWREKQMTTEKLDDVILHPTTEKLRAIISCRTRPEIERYRAALVNAQNANKAVTELVNRVVRQRFSEIANGITTSKIVLPEDYFERRTDPKEKELEELKMKNAEMAEQMLIMQKQLADLLAAKEKPEKTKTRSKPKAEPTAE